MKTKEHTDNNILSQLLNESVEVEDEVIQFFEAVQMAEILQKWGCTKRSGLPPINILKDILSLRLERISVEENKEVGKVPTDMSKDCYYRFLQKQDTDWIRITTDLAHAYLCDRFPDYDENTENTGIFLYDDTAYKREYSENTEMLSNQYDHANHLYYIGGRLGMLDYLYAGEELPINAVLATSTDSKNYKAPPKDVAKDTPAAERRELASSQLNENIFKQIEIAQELGIKSDHVAFDSWFSMPKTIIEFVEVNLDVIGRMKTGPTIKYLYNGKKLDLEELYHEARFTLPTSSDPDILFSVKAEICSGDKTLPIKLVFCRNYASSKKEFVAIVSTDIDFDDDTILQLYRGRWKEEVINREIKSRELMLSKSNQSLDLDSIYANIAIILILCIFLRNRRNYHNNSDSIQRSFHRRGAYANNGRVVRSLVASLRAIIKYLEENYNLDDEKLIDELSQVILKDGSFNFYLEHAPIS